MLFAVSMEDERFSPPPIWYVVNAASPLEAARALLVARRREHPDSVVQFPHTWKVWSLHPDFGSLKPERFQQRDGWKKVYCVDHFENNGYRKREFALEDMFDPSSEQKFRL